MDGKKIEQDDAEGNVWRSGRVETGENETDTEGARFSKKADDGDSESDDTEGNRRHLRS